MIALLDMDGPITALNKVVSWDNGYPPEISNKGFFRNLPVQDGAKWGVSEIMKMDHIDLYICTKYTNVQNYCFSEKADWIAEHFPELSKKMFVVCDKGMMRGDYLIDDYRERWEPVFKGKFLWFDNSRPLESWKRICWELSNKGLRAA